VSEKPKKAELFLKKNKQTKKNQMLLHLLLILPILGIFSIASISYNNTNSNYMSLSSLPQNLQSALNKYYEDLAQHNDLNNINNEKFTKNDEKSFFKNLNDNTEIKLNKNYKIIALIFSILNLSISLLIYLLFDFNNNQFQYIQEQLNISLYDIYLGIDGISIYFVLLTTIITPISIISN
jgi:NADH-ubiquinone oxidoreductase chain 4